MLRVVGSHVPRRYFHISGNMIDFDEALATYSSMPKKLDLARLAQRLEALGDPTRLAVYRVLVRAGTEGLPVGRIQEKTKVPRSTLSHHLHKLIAVGLVSQERRGTTLICRANYPAMRQIVDELVAECCADASCASSEAAA
jgi:ArsR family transcriptional regulator, arsenate/arsenite/antimonite-responsive transcriptional repressor